MSFNQYMAQPSGKMLHEMYLTCWRKGLKTTYYLRSQAATQVEKSTSDVNKRGFQPRWMKSKSASSNVSAGNPELNKTTSEPGPPSPDNTPQAQAVPVAAEVAGKIGPAEPITKAAANGWAPVADQAAATPPAAAREDLDLGHLKAAGNACSIDNPDCEACQ